MVELPPSLAEIHAGLDRARSEFHSLVDRATHNDLQRKSEGTKWTNRQLLFHMLFGYLITRNLRVIVKVLSRAPDPAQRGFAGMLDAATRPFHKCHPPGRTHGWGGSSHHCSAISIESPTSRCGGPCDSPRDGIRTSPTT